MGDILYSTGADGTVSVKAASIDRVVAMLADTKSDMSFAEDIVLTFPTFIMASLLLQKLQEQWRAARPHLAIQMKIASVLRALVDLNFDASMERPISDILAELAADHPTPAAEDHVLQVRHAMDVQLGRVSGVPVFAEKPPKPIFPKNSKVQTIDEVHPKEIARQISLLAHESYSKIRVSELLNQAWSKKDKSTAAPNVLAFIDRFNKTSVWVASMVILPADVIRRAMLIGYFIKVAKELQGLKNFDGMQSILSGLQHTAVVRLRQTWRLVKDRTEFEEMKALMKFDHNYKVYREHVSNHVTPPAIPFIAPFLSDLTFADENPKELNGLLNVSKCRLIARTLGKIRQFQKAHYNFEVVDIVRKYLKGISQPSDAELYALSQQREEKGDESQAGTAVVNNIFG
jgi:son of sevenless-like protein